MGASHHPFLRLLALFLGISYAFFFLAAAVPATSKFDLMRTGSVKGDVIIVKTEPFSGSASEDFEGEGEGWFVEGRMELEKENDYPDPGANPRHDPPPNPSRS